MLVLSLLLCAVASARADTIFLKNGNQLEGTITAQNRDELTLNIGYGTVSVKRSDVRRIKRSKTGADFENREFEAGHRVPERAENLNELYQEASRQREKALDLKQKLQAFDDAAKEAQEELPRLRESYEAAADRMKGTGAAANPSAYNAAVQELNSIRTQMQVDGNRVEDAQAQRREGQKGIQEYSNAYHALREALASPASKELQTSAKGWQAQYYAWLKRQVVSMSRDFTQEIVESVDHGGHVVVRVMVNGRVPARLLVDTGASISVLYPSVYDELGLSPSKDIGSTKMVLGDGHTVDARVVRLDSIAVGGSWVMGAAAALVPTPAPGIDGLLGMSFLSHFIVRVDSANGKLILESLKQEKQTP